MKLPRPSFRSIVRLALGFLFVWAAVGKLADPQAFLSNIYAYDLPFPDVLLRLSAVWVPWIELLCGLLLIANVWPEAALSVLAVLFGFFIAFTGQAWIRGLDISCGCFDVGIFSKGDLAVAIERVIDSVQFAFFRNLVLTAGVIYLLYGRIRSLRSGSEQQKAGENGAPSQVPNGN